MICAATTAGSATSGKPLISSRGTASRPQPGMSMRAAWRKKPACPSRRSSPSCRAPLRAADRRKPPQGTERNGPAGDCGGYPHPLHPGRRRRPWGQPAPAASWWRRCCRIPDEVPYVQAIGVRMDTILLLPEMQAGNCRQSSAVAEQKQPVNLTTLQQRLDEQAVPAGGNGPGTEPRPETGAAGY